VNECECEDGYYTGKGGCVLCGDDGETTRSGFTSICTCKVGFYLGDSGCRKCDEGLTTEDKGATSIGECNICDVESHSDEEEDDSGGDDDDGDDRYGWRLRSLGNWSSSYDDDMAYLGTYGGECSCPAWHYMGSKKCESFTAWFGPLVMFISLLMLVLLLVEVWKGTEHLFPRLLDCLMIVMVSAIYPVMKELSSDLGGSNDCINNMMHQYVASERAVRTKKTTSLFCTLLKVSLIALL